MQTVRDHRLESVIHTGAVSEIWSATRLGPSGFALPVVLKTLNDSCSVSAEHVRAIIKEARAASCVQHRNIVQLHDLILDRGRHWIAMELVRGWSLRELLSSTEATGDQIPVPVALSLARDAAQGLQAIHDAGLVHRNLTPDNLMVSSAGQLVLLDFGRATWQRPAPVAPGPPASDAPPRAPADPRADVLHLGAILDQMIRQRRDAPVALDAIIRRALDPDAGRRFPSARALETALDLVSIREGWLVTPSYVAAYLSDMFRPRALATPPPRAAAHEPTRPAAVVTAPAADHASVRRAVLPRGRRGMVGVGATLSGARVKHGPGGITATRDEEPYNTVSRTATPQTVTRIRVRR